MKKILLLLTIVFLTTLISADSDWTDEQSWNDEKTENEESENIAFERTKIKNRSKQVYEDKVYKYITGDYQVSNNEIELATVHLKDNIKSDDVDINVIVDHLNVEGDRKKDPLPLKRNEYRHFVNNDERPNLFPENSNEQERDELSPTDLRTEIQSHDSRYKKVEEPDISEIEVIDLRNNDRVKEVNVLIENTDILVR